jgi:hypothetical protein
MTRFVITSHADGGCRSITIKDQPMGDGKTLQLDFERELARELKTELVVMHEFELEGEATVCQWSEAVRVFEAYWAGHDAPRLRDDWRGCPWHSGELHAAADALPRGRWLTQTDEGRSVLRHAFMELGLDPGLVPKRD